MPFCPECGSEIGPKPDDTQSGPSAAEVRIAEIQADRDIQIARLQTKQQREANETVETVAETEAAADVGVAEAQADGMEAAAEAIAAEPEPEPEGAPIVVETRTEPEPAPDMAPPETQHHAPETKKSSGWWDGYR